MNDWPQSAFCAWTRANIHCQWVREFLPIPLGADFLKFPHRSSSDSVPRSDHFASRTLAARCAERRASLGMEGKMIFVVNAGNRRLFEPDLMEMHRQRKTVFVDRIGWKIPVVTDMEIDCYDQEDTMYLLAKDKPDGELLASVRLLPTVGPHLMSDLFAAACRDATPRGPAIWEVSRFCTAPGLQGRHVRVELLWEIICGVMETALLYGVDQVIFAANRALLPLALSCGWQARTLGPTMRDEDDEVTAAIAAITPDGLRCVRERHGIAVPVTRLHANATPCSHHRFESESPFEEATVLHMNAEERIGQQRGDRSGPGESSHG